MKVSEGYFLIEILIVLAIISLLASIAIPSLNFLDRQLISSDLEKLNLAFYYMQQSAIASNRNLYLKFEDLKSYSYDNYKEYLSKNVEFGNVNELKGPPSTQEKFNNKSINFVNNRATFYSNGKIQPGSIYLTNKNKEYQYALTTPISQVSYIRKYKFENNKWHILN